MSKTVNRISDDIVIEALQVIHNYCNQESADCAECMLHMKDTTCLFFAELPDRFDAWKKENNIQVVGTRAKRRK